MDGAVDRAAATLAAELGDITRFDNPRQLMAYLGLVPSEHSSGGTRRQGGITKAGNCAARRRLNDRDAVFEDNMVHRLFEPQPGQPAPVHRRPGWPMVVVAVTQKEAG
jgi:hypothetical protein